MSLLKKLQDKFNKQDKFDIELTLANGEIVKVITEAQEPKEGDQVVDANGNPVEDKDHLLPDGGKIVTVGGAITEIQKPEDADEDEGEEEPTLTEVMNSVNGLTKSFNSFKTSVEKSAKDSEKSIEFLGDQLSEYETKFSTLAKSVKSKFSTPPAEETGGKRQGETSLYDRVQAKMKAKEQSEK